MLFLISFIMSKKRIAILGGRFGKHHAKGYAAANTEIVAVLNNSLINAKRDSEFINSHYGFESRPYDSLDKLLNNEHAPNPLWGASIALPLNLHVPYAKKLLEEGINLLIEKPNFNSVEDYLQVAYLARKNKVILASQHQWAAAIETFSKFFSPEKIQNFKDFKYISVNTGTLKGKELFIDMIDHPISILTEIAGIRDGVKRTSYSLNGGEASMKFRYRVPEGNIDCEVVFVQDNSLNNNQKYTELILDEDSIKHRPVYSEGNFIGEVFETIDNAQTTSPDFLLESVKRFAQGRPIVDYVKGINTVSVRERLLNNI